MMSQRLEWNCQTAKSATAVDFVHGCCAIGMDSDIQRSLPQLWGRAARAVSAPRLDCPIGLVAEGELPLPGCGVDRSIVLFGAVVFAVTLPAPCPVDARFTV